MRSLGRGTRTMARFGLAVLLVGGIGAGVARVPDLLAGVEVFRLRGVGLEGARFLTLEDVASIAAPPAGASVWDDPEPWVASLREHPLVQTVEVRRRLPDSLVLHVTEVEPVAFVATPTLEPVDADGRRLPIDPSRHRLDLPLLGVPASADPGGRLGVRPLAREIDRLGEIDPAFVAMLSELSWAEAGEAVALWGQPGVEVRFRPPLSAVRLRQALAVLADVTGRYPDRRPRAVDLRYAEQVVVRF